MVDPVRREFSAGGVLVRREGGHWLMAAIRTAGKRDVWALPKGRIDDGETGEQTALREVGEETGAHGRSLGKLGDIAPEFAHEIDEVGWLRLDEADMLLTHKGEREMAERALARLSEQDV